MTFIQIVKLDQFGDHSALTCAFNDLSNVNWRGSAGELARMESADTARGHQPASAISPSARAEQRSALGRAPTVIPTLCGITHFPAGRVG